MFYCKECKELIENTRLLAMIPLPTVGVYATFHKECLKKINSNNQEGE